MLAIQLRAERKEGWTTQMVKDFEISITDYFENVKGRDIGRLAADYSIPPQATYGQRQTHVLMHSYRIVRLLLVLLAAVCIFAEIEEVADDSKYFNPCNIYWVLHGFSQIASLSSLLIPPGDEVQLILCNLVK
ncbi:hypothetical protein TELCIR_02800 [Teladorsagia circumcincta]|uniref:Uncharacterized protein n=1 Tax=Teladorsagia circumcincta TaxID=45464 RepID=A0A2G9V068_TELCI|nr:hypothetical protein TELCIR_02800 [Teladorsagia circumcincta]